ncbi:hypothetical protein [Sphingobacterium paludis]|uniref:Lipoprotein n=1 Tax=Sphingobacterium paludis TaxID=1476465 RepID=A0A4R7D4R4_9SPHI|nr:hypothetical protein [Sphingobacterium paludis]TDS14685.1 hypothetical protein B0I21_103180 [Sphingobacterium paludis]
MKTIRFFLALVSISLSSCTSILMRFMGVQHVAHFDESRYRQNASALLAKYPGPKQDILIADTGLIRYSTLFDSLESKFALQPIQMLYFDADKKLRSFHVNCLAPGGVGKLKWNIDDRFANYIPKTAAPVDYEQWNVDDLTEKLGINELDIPEGKDVVVFFWSRLLHKQVKHAHKEIITNIKNHVKPDDFPVILYLNTDKVYASLNSGGIDSTFLKNVLTEDEYKKHRLKVAGEKRAQAVADDM